MPKTLPPHSAADVTADRRMLGKTAWQWLHDHQPNWSVDKLLTYPDVAKDLCKAVRSELCRRFLADHEILQALVNERKRGRTTAVRRK